MRCSPPPTSSAGRALSGSLHLANTDIYQAGCSVSSISSCGIRFDLRNVCSEVVTGRHFPGGQPALLLWSAQKKSRINASGELQSRVFSNTFEIRRVSICGT